MVILFMPLSKATLSTSALNFIFSHLHKDITPGILFSFFSFIISPFLWIFTISMNTLFLQMQKASSLFYLVPPSPPVVPFLIYDPFNDPFLATINNCTFIQNFLFSFSALYNLEKKGKIGCFGGSKMDGGEKLKRKHHSTPLYLLNFELCKLIYFLK